jgi:excisionase family DNA binding protein
MSEHPLAGVSFLRTDDAAERLGWTEAEVLGAVELGDLPAIIIGDAYRIPERAVDDLAATVAAWIAEPALCSRVMTAGPESSSTGSGPATPGAVWSASRGSCLRATG